MCAVAAGHISDLSALLHAAWSVEHRAHAILTQFEALQFRAPFDGHALGRKRLHQKPLVLVLGQAEREGIGAQAFAHIVERKSGNFRTALAQANYINLGPCDDDRLREAELTNDDEP